MKFSLITAASLSALALAAPLDNSQQGSAGVDHSSESAGASGKSTLPIPIPIPVPLPLPIPIPSSLLPNPLGRLGEKVKEARSAYIVAKAAYIGAKIGSAASGPGAYFGAKYGAQRGVQKGFKKYGKRGGISSLLPRPFGGLFGRSIEAQEASEAADDQVVDNPVFRYMTENGEASPSGEGTELDAAKIDAVIMNAVAALFPAEASAAAASEAPKASATPLDDANDD